MSVAKDMRELAMEYVVEMMLEDRAARERRPARDLFREFRRSGTMNSLFDAETGLWENGPDYLSDEWTMELAAQGIATR